jgi:hypothetical protein
MRAMTEGSSSYVPTSAPAVTRQRRIRVGAVVALAIAIGFVAWLVLRDGGSPSSTSPIPAGSKPLPISAKGLQTLASLGIRIYWVGPRTGYTYELTKTSDNRVFIRYLPDGAKVGSEKPYLTIGTYPAKNAYATARRRAGRTGAVKVPAGKGVAAYYRNDTPANVFLAVPGSDYTIEVYDPSPGRARDLVASGQVTAAR